MKLQQQKTSSVDKILLSIIIFLMIAGFMIFFSSAMGLIPRGGAEFKTIITNQFLFGVVLGSVALLISSKINYKYWRRYSLYIFLASILLSILVFVPGIGMSHGGATRWIDLGFATIQPSEFLKIGMVIFLASWLSYKKNDVNDIKHGLLPFVGMLSLIGLIMLKQPDTDTFMIIAASSLTMFIVAGAKWRYVISIILSGVLLLAVMAQIYPHVKDRFLILMKPLDFDILNKGYQTKQSLIAVGSGGLTGRGFGQSIQKFKYLPEPIGDSVFAVFAEEFGFVGSVILILTFIMLLLRSYKIATQTNDLFATLLVIGFVTIITAQAFLNIGSMIKVAPLSGLPLPLISHGGTATIVTLISLGIILNVSKNRVFSKKT